MMIHPLLAFSSHLLPAGFGSGDTNADGFPNWSDPWTLSDLIMDLLFCCDLALNFVTTGDM